MLTKTQTWAEFSHKIIGDPSQHANSLETIHDSIHVLVGGSVRLPDSTGTINGHMATIIVAGEPF